MKQAKLFCAAFFTPETIDMTGSRFNIGELNYIVIGKATDGKGGYEVQCETAGIIGNQFFGSVIPIEYIKGLQTAELTDILIPGEDEETTEDLRQRYFDSFEETAFGGNVKDYLEKTNAIPGVGRTKVARVWNSDISPADMLPSEDVQNWYENIKNAVSGDVKNWLDAVYYAAKEKKLTTGGTVLLTIINSEFGVASDALVQTVQETIDPEQNAGEGFGLAPIGHVVTVQSAEAVQIFVKTTLTFDEGYGWENLQSLIQDAVSNYLLELRKEWAESSCLIIRLSQIDTRLLGVRGVIDVQDTLLNGSRNNITLGKYEIPVLGGVGA